jgi:ABC-2 type transport system permease protein
MEWRLYVRNPGAMFWTFAFPMLLLVGFGTIFRSGSTPALTLVVAGVDRQATPGRLMLQALGRTPLKLLELDPASADARWRRGETAAQLEPATGGGFTLKVNTYLAAQGQMAAQVVQEANLAVQIGQDGREPHWLPVLVESPGHTRSGNYAAFLLPGLLGLNLLSMGLFSVGMVNVAYREKGKFRRLAVTPLPKWVFLMGQVLQRLAVAFLQAALLLALGYFAFGIDCQGSYLLLAAVLTLGTACFMTLGFALAGFAQTSETYAALANAFFFPMMLLSGVYFTLDSAPRWIQMAVQVLPMSPYLKTLRAVFNDGAGLAGHWAGLGVVAAWTVLGFAVAVKRFRWA